MVRRGSWVRFPPPALVPPGHRVDPPDILAHRSGAGVAPRRSRYGPSEHSSRSGRRMVTEAEDRVRAGGPGPATRRAAVNAAVVAAAQIAGKVAGLAYTIAAVRILGERQFGTFAYAMSFCLLVAT